MADEQMVLIDKRMADGMEAALGRVIRLHQPKDGHCQECANSEDLAKFRSYPCATVLAIIGDGDEQTL